LVRPEQDGWRSSDLGRDLAPGITVGIAAAIVDGRRSWALEGHRAFPAASRIKAAILAALAQTLNAGRLSLSDRRVVKGDPIVPGNGVCSPRS
jgi:beta-lactamase class A